MHAGSAVDRGEHPKTDRHAGRGPGLLLLQRGLLPGVRPLWPLLVLWYAACLALAGVALGDWIRWVVLAVAATLGAMGASWLFTPLVRLDEGEDHFPDV